MRFSAIFGQNPLEGPRFLGRRACHLKKLHFSGLIPLLGPRFPRPLAEMAGKVKRIFGPNQGKSPRPPSFLGLKTGRAVTGFRLIFYIFLSFLPTSLSAARAFGRILLAKPKKLAKLDTRVNCAQQAIGAKRPTTVADFR